MRIATLITVLTLIAGVSLLPAEDISGSLSGTLAADVYTVVGDCWVNVGNTLTIEAGCEFQHTGNYDWTFNGIVQANGTEANPIIFTRESPIPTNNWGGMRFPSASSSGSQLEYCTIEYCDNSTRSGGGLYAYLADITLRHCIIAHCKGGDGGGIFAQSSDIILEYCEVYDNQAINGTYTDGNGGGIYLLQSPGAHISYSAFHHNHSSGA